MQRVARLLVGSAVARRAARPVRHSSTVMGLMQHHQLNVSSMISFAAQHHGDTEVVSRTVEGPIHRYTYADAHTRSKKVANALKALGVEQGNTVGTLAWNGYRHLELYYGVSGSGAVLHTVNPRLFPEQLVYIINHGDDKVLFFELNLLPLVEKLVPGLKGVKHFVLMTDAAHMPKTCGIPNLLCYETLVEQSSAEYQWPMLEENSACSLCYTSGTTGDPKGVLYSHRSNVLHALAISLPDSVGVSALDAVLPVVPMFHVNAWGISYACPMVGAKCVFPGPFLDGESVYNLMKSERVTIAAGVPTVWLGLLQHMEKGNLRLPDLKRTVIGGAAAPRSMIEAFENKFGIPVIHAWGMTETSPIGLICMPKQKHFGESPQQAIERKVKQGRVVYGVDISVVDASGKEIPRDGKAFGNFRVRGPWIAREYFKKGKPCVDKDGFFDTGDVVTVDPDGYVQITDRSKDLIKSGGEWISSIDVENMACGHPAVHEAAVIGVPHPKWDERPILLVVLKPGASATGTELIEYLRPKLAKLWVPDVCFIVKELPHTATGKVQKNILRDTYKGTKLA